MELNNEAKKCASLIKLLAVDCDGVLTDGRLYFGESGETMKVFHVHDGQGISSWLAAGLVFAVVTARSSAMLTARAAELGIKHVIQNANDKGKAISRICEVEGIELSEAAYVGDDLADIEAMKVVGLPISVANGSPEVIRAALAVTIKNGGQGAVREVVDTLLSARV